MFGLPDVFNAATRFVDRNIHEGRGAKVAIECGDERVTYQQVFDRVNRVGNALREELGVRLEERVMLLLLDTPEFIYSFFGAIKIGAVPIPTSTLWKPADYEYVLNDSRARVIIVSEQLLPHIQAIPPDRLRHVREIVVVGDPAEAREAGPNRLRTRALPRVSPKPKAKAEGPAVRTLAALTADASGDLEAEPTSKDDPAFWLYSSGSTGFPKGCVHLHHDMVVCTELYAKGVLGISADDRCFSVAKLFFAYGLGNAMYFPFGVGATTILWPGSPAAANVYAVIEKHRPTLFYSVPTNYGMLLAHQRDGADFDLSSIRYGVSAGEALPPALFERFKQRFGVEVLDGIGSTEILHIFISNRPGAIRPGSSGQIVPGYEARILDEENRPVPPGDIGNLLIAGDSTCACVLEQAREDEGNDRRPVDPDRRQVLPGRRRLLLVRRPLRRHAQGRWHLGKPGRNREHPHRARVRARVRRRRTHRSRWVDEAVRLRRPPPGNYGHARPCCGAAAVRS